MKNEKYWTEENPKKVYNPGSFMHKVLTRRMRRNKEKIKNYLYMALCLAGLASLFFVGFLVGFGDVEDEIAYTLTFLSTAASIYGFEKMK